MNVYIVSYELSNPTVNSEELLALIKEQKHWARLGQAAYLVVTEGTPVDLRNQFKSALRANDRLFVGSISAPAAWTGMSDKVSNWIKKHLR